MLEDWNGVSGLLGWPAPEGHPEAMRVERDWWPAPTGSPEEELAWRRRMRRARRRRRRPVWRPRWNPALVVIGSIGASVWLWSRLLGLAPGDATGGAEARIEAFNLRGPAMGQPVQVAGATTAPYCAPGKGPSFQMGFAELRAQIGDRMGNPVECEHVDAATGNTLQRTPLGTAVYWPGANVAGFTNGQKTWVLTASGLIDRPGDERAGAPIAAPRAAPTPGAVSTNAAMRVANTDGAGVVLRAAPSDGARVPRGLLEGTRVQVLERSGDQWVHVRADNGLEGWVPPRYLAPAEQ